MVRCKHRRMPHDGVLLMKTLRYLIQALVLTALIGSTASAQVDPNADIVYLQTNCAGVADCFTSTFALTSWIAGTRQPTAAEPLLVEAGPGEFEPILCDPSTAFGHTTFRGAGRERTVFKVSNCFLCAAISAQDPACTDLEFQDLTADGDFWGTVWFEGAGDSSWTNVDILGGRVGWYELSFNCQPELVALHFFWNARIVARKPDGFAGNGYESNCSETWFYGSDISVLAGADAVAGTGYTDNIAAIVVGGGALGSGVTNRIGDVRAFGTTFRIRAADVPDGVLPPDGIVGVRVFDEGEFHMHGGIINVTVSPTNASEVVGVKVLSGGFAHTPDTAFNIRAGGGATHRIQGAAALSPFLHPAADGPPLSNPADPNSARLQTTIGSDLFVERDCNPMGDCSSTGTQTHLMVSNPNCGAANPWFNIVTGACRQGP